MCYTLDDAHSEALFSSRGQVCSLRTVREGSRTPLSVTMKGIPVSFREILSLPFSSFPKTASKSRGKLMCPLWWREVSQESER